MPGDLPRRTDALVVGAGLAGLRTADLLVKSGIETTVIESAAAVGGRIRTDTLDGFLLDRGFQLYNPAYPAGRATFDYAGLDLRPFERGVLVVDAEGEYPLLDPRRARDAPRTIVTSLTGHAGRPWQQAPFAAYVAACSRLPVARLAERPDLPIGTALRRWGVAGRFLRAVVQPFLAGVFGEDALLTSRRYADLVLRSFDRGTPTVPAGGMAALPQQICDRLPTGSVHTGVQAYSLAGADVRTSASTIRARAIVIATGGPAAARLLGHLPAPRMNALTTWYFALPAPILDTIAPTRRPLVRVDAARRGPLRNLAVMSDVNPGYAPPGTALVAATAVGHHDDGLNAGRARYQAGLMLGVDPGMLSAIRHYAIADALPAMISPARLEQPVDLGSGLFVAGDHRQTPSIQGALVSGRRAARAVVAALTGSTV